MAIVGRVLATGDLTYCAHEKNEFSKKHLRHPTSLQNCTPHLTDNHLPGGLQVQMAVHATCRTQLRDASMRHKPRAAIRRDIAGWKTQRPKNNVWAKKMLQEWVFSARKRPLLMASLRCHRRSLRKQHLNWTSGTARTSRFSAGDTVFAEEDNLKKDGRPPSAPRNTECRIGSLDSPIRKRLHREPLHVRTSPVALVAVLLHCR